MHPHGVRYDKASEGTVYNPAGAGAQVPIDAGMLATYTVRE